MKQESSLNNLLKATSRSIYNINNNQDDDDDDDDDQVDDENDDKVVFSLITIFFL